MAKRNRTELRYEAQRFPWPYKRVGWWSHIRSSKSLVGVERQCFSFWPNEMRYGLRYEVQKCSLTLQTGGRKAQPQLAKLTCALNSNAEIKCRFLSVIDSTGVPWHCCTPEYVGFSSVCLIQRKEDLRRCINFINSKNLIITSRCFKVFLKTKSLNFDYSTYAFFVILQSTLWNKIRFFGF